MVWDKKVYIWREPITNRKFKATKEQIYHAELIINNALQIDGEMQFDNYLLELGMTDIAKYFNFAWKESDGRVIIFFRMSRMEKGVIELEYSHNPYTDSYGQWS